MNEKVCLIKKLDFDRRMLVMRLKMDFVKQLDDFISNGNKSSGSILSPLH